MPIQLKEALLGVTALVLGITLFVAMAYLKPVNYVGIDKNQFYELTGASGKDIAKGIVARGDNPEEKTWKYYKYTREINVPIDFKEEHDQVKVSAEFYYVKYGNQAIRVYKPKLQYKQTDGIVIKQLDNIGYSIGKRGVYLSQEVMAEKQSPSTTLRNHNTILIELTDL